MLFEDIWKISGSHGNVRAPPAKAAVSVYCVNPFSEEIAFGSILLGVLTFHFQGEHFPRGEADEVVGAIFEYDPLEYIENFEPQVIVFHPCLNVRVSI